MLVIVAWAKYFTFHSMFVTAIWHSLWTSEISVRSVAVLGPHCWAYCPVQSASHLQVGYFSQGDVTPGWVADIRRHWSCLLMPWVALLYYFILLYLYIYKYCKVALKEFMCKEIYPCRVCLLALACWFPCFVDLYWLVFLVVITI